MSNIIHKDFIKTNNYKEFSASETNYTSMQNQHNRNQTVQQNAQNLPQVSLGNQGWEQEPHQCACGGVLSRSLTNAHSQLQQIDTQNYEYAIESICNCHDRIIAKNVAIGKPNMQSLA